MERASRAFTERFTTHYPDTDRPVYVCCGTGNNGGDGLVIARLLYQRAYPITILRCHVSEQASEDFATQWERLPTRDAIEVLNIHPDDPLPTLPEETLLIDALFGTGLSRPVRGYWARLLEHLNQMQLTRVAVDVPSGVFTDRHTDGVSFRAHQTLTFQLPKLAFLLPENTDRIGDWEILDIGLSTAHLAQLETNHYLLTETEVGSLLKRRGKYDHKGTFGHALMVCGSHGKVGAATLSARAALRSGAGLVTIHAPRCAYDILQISFPEAMVRTDQHQTCITEVGSVDSYAAIGVGCGIGTNELTHVALLDLLQRSQQPLVIDADALNLIAHHEELLAAVPANSILTPHPKEFERLFGDSQNDFARLRTLRQRAQKHRIIIVLKGGTTVIATPEGQLFFSDSGNPGMGTGGTGDVLTGILTGLLAQGYTPTCAARLGVYLHGLAGDLAAERLEQEALLASDVIAHLGTAIGRLRAAAK